MLDSHLAMLKFAKEFLPVLKTRIPGHFKLREFHESSIEYPFLPHCNPLCLKKKKQTAQAKGDFYLKPGEWRRNARDKGRVVPGSHPVPAVCIQVTEDCEPVPFFHLRMEPISFHLSEETLCYLGINLRWFGEPRGHAYIHVSVLSIFKIFYILKIPFPVLVPPVAQFCPF